MNDLSRAEELALMRQAREVLRPFRDWMIRSRGYSDQVSDGMVAITVRAIWEHPGEDGEPPDPVQALSEPMTHPNYSKVKSALTRYYTWLSIQAPTETEREVARKQLARVARWRSPIISDTGMAFISEGRKPCRGTTLQSGDLEKLEHLIKRLSAWSKPISPRWPWARPVLGMHLKMGTNTREIGYLTRSCLGEARLSGPKTGILELTRRHNGKRDTRPFPVGLVWKEGEMLARWPWEWSVLADVIAPGVAPHRRIGQASKLINLALKRMMEDEVEEVLGEQRLRHATWAWLMKQLKNDWLALIRITSATEVTLRRIADVAGL